MKHRRKGREFALQALYAQTIGDTPLTNVESKITQGLKAEPEAVAYGRLLLAQVSSHAGEIDSALARHVKGWEPERITVIDRIILHCSIAEMQYLSDVPIPVAITEAVQIANKYSTPKSSSFINGILDSFAAESTNTNRKE